MRMYAQSVSYLQYQETLYFYCIGVIQSYGTFSNYLLLDLFNN